MSSLALAARELSHDIVRRRSGGRVANAGGLAFRVIAALGLTFSPVTAQAQEAEEPPRLKLLGTTRSEGAIALGGARLTKLRQYLSLSGSYALKTPKTSGLRADLHVTLRGYYDGVHALTDEYPARVRRDEQDELALREAVLSLTSGPLSVQLGKQQTVWGEAVALFFADVVNAKDLREFILRDFTDIRVPVWSIDARYHASRGRVLELYWSPDVRFSRLPQPGAEFALFREEPPDGVAVRVRPTPRPAVTFGNSSRGLRFSQLWKGWDLAGFWYSSLDDLPGISKKAVVIGGGPAVAVSLLHPRVERYGATFSKPSGSGVWKGEFVYTTGRRVEARAVAPALERDELTAMVGASYPVSRYNADVQVFHTRILGDTGPMLNAASRIGLSLRLADDASLQRLKPSLLLVWSVNQKDFWVRPRVQYRVDDDTTLTVGFDWFGGGRRTLFGQFRDSSRFEVQLSRRLF